jgi:glucose uptake protein GlcU
MQLLGLILLIISVFLCVYQPGKKSFSLKWVIYVFFFFIFASGVGIIFKTFSKYGGNTDLSAMMICSALVMMVAFLIISISYRPENFLKDDTGIKRFLLYAIISGVLSCGYNRLNAFLSGALHAVIFFPGFNGGVVLVSTIMGILLCREKYNAKKIIALLLGTVSIVIIGIF